MELLYICYESENFSSKQEINLSHRYHIKYEKNNLTINKKERTISFELKNEKKLNYTIAMQGIIGENGSGKTTYIKNIYNLLNPNWNIPKCKIVYVFKGKEVEAGNEGFFIWSNEDNINRDDGIPIYTTFEKLYFLLKQAMDESIVIHYSPAFRTDYKFAAEVSQHKNHIDISTDGLIRESSKKNTKKNVQVYNLLDIDDKLNILEFISDEKMNKSLNCASMRFKKPTQLKMEIISDNFKYFDRKMYNSKKSIIDSYKKKFNQIKNEDKKIAKLAFILSLLFNIKEKIGEEISVESFDNVIELIELNDSTEFADKLAEYKVNYDNIINRNDLEYVWGLLEHNNLVISENIETKEKIKYSRWSVSKNLQSKDECERVIKLYGNNFLRGIINLKWVGVNGYSSGEYSALLMFSRIHKAIKEKVKEKINTLIILLDEPDLYYHPNWKKYFINDLIQFLDAILNAYPDTNLKNIKIIITTNEPYIISDLPKENIIFLKNENGQCKVCDNNAFDQTFGTNIHTLLTNSFFMDSTIGEFAKTKINSVIDKLNLSNKEFEEKIVENKNNYENELNKMRAVIDIIGEPVVRKKMLDLYSEKVKYFNEKYNIINENYGRVKELIDHFNMLTDTEKSNFIEGIIATSKGGHRND